MEPIYKLSSGNRVSIQDNIIFVKDLTGMIGGVDYVENPDEPNTFIERINTTGYGAETRERADVALFLFAYIRTTKGDVEIPVETYEPLMVETFRMKFSGDGWYVFQLYAVKLKREGEVYGEGEIIYDTALGVVRVEGENLVKVDLKKLPILMVTESDKPVLLEGIRQKMKLNNRINQIQFGGDTTGHKLMELKEEYNVLRILLRGAFGEFNKGNKYVFQKHAEYITSNHCS